MNTENDKYYPTLKEIFSKGFSNIIDVFKSLVSLGSSITESDFGILCARSESILNIIFATSNPIFQIGDKFDFNFFQKHNISLYDSKTFTSETHNLIDANLRILSERSSKYFYISSPINLFNKLFGYLVLFKNNNNYYPEEVRMVDNYKSYISVQIEKLIKKEKQISNNVSGEGIVRSVNSLREPVYYFYNIRNNKYFFPGKNLLNELGYLNYNPEFDIQNIINPEDLYTFNSRNSKMSSFTKNNVYEMNFRVKDSTGKWRLFCQRDIVYSIDSAGNPEEILSIINELDYQYSDKEQNEFKGYIKYISNFKNKLDMDSEMTEILDMNIIQNLKDLGGENDSSFLKEVIDLYLDQAPGLLNDIKTAARDKNSLKMSQSAHALKGASLNIGAKKFSEVCKELEFKGKENNLEDVDKLLKELDKSYIITSDELRKLVN